jgi:hypothetical protein
MAIAESKSLLISNKFPVIVLCYSISPKKWIRGGVNSKAIGDGGEEQYLVCGILWREMMADDRWLMAELRR